MLLGAWALTALPLAAPARHLTAQEDEGGLRSLAQDLAGQGLRVQALGASPHALDALEAPERAVLVVAGVERAYTAGEVAAVQGFVARGGTALVADDFGFGDALGRPFGVNFDERVLRDASFDGNQSLVRVDATAAGQNFSLLTNVPSSLGFAPGVERRILAQSGPDSYQDINQDGVEDPNDVKGPFPVIAAVPWGRGQAVFASDPGLLTNGLWSTDGAFWRAFFRERLPDGGEVVVDNARHPLGPAGGALGALLAGLVMATSEAPLSVVVGLGAIALAALAWSTFRKPEDISAHRSRLALPIHAWDEAVRRARLREFALRSVGDANNLAADVVEATPPAQLAALAKDPVLGALVQGKDVRATDRELLSRIQALAKRGGAR